MSERPISGNRGRHILVVSYYFPPMGLSGVQRVAKFVKYLPGLGWDVSVLTVTPHGYFAFDDSLARELPDTVNVVRTSSFDPTRLYGTRETVKLPSEPTRNRLATISQLVFVPDNKIGWYPSAVRAARNLHRKSPIDVVFSSAPPYTAHLVARTVALRASASLVLDFRHDWLGNPRHTYPTRLHHYVQRRLERRVIHAADAVTTVNSRISSALDMRHVNRPGGTPIITIPHGYDPDDFGHQDAPEPPSGLMSFLYAGIFYDVQSPEPFLRGLKRALASRPELDGRVRAEFVGLVPDGFDELVESLGLQSVVAYHGYQPHSQVTRMIASAAVLWLTIGRRPGAERLSLGKLHEYFGSRRPVLGLVPEGVVRDDLLQYGAAEIVDPDDEEGIARGIVRLYDRWKEGRLPAGRPEFIALFDRTELTRQLSDVLDEAVASRSRRMATG